MFKIGRHRNKNALLPVEAFGYELVKKLKKLLLALALVA